MVARLAWSPAKVPDASDPTSATFSPPPNPGTLIVPTGIGTAEALGTPSLSSPFTGLGAIGESAIGQIAIGAAPLNSSGQPQSAFRSAGNNWFRDNGGKFTVTGSGVNQYLRHSSFARVVLQTDSNFDGNLSVSAVPANATYADSNAICVRVDGVFYQTIQYDFGSINTIETKSITLPTGAHTIELEEGSAPSTGGNDCSITALKFFGRVVPATPPVRRLVIYGNSIANGAFAVPRDQCWPQLMRHGSRFDGVTTLGCWGLALHDEALTTPLITALVAEIVGALDGTVENVLLLGLITNDYLAHLWTAAAYGTALGNVLDAIHAALPSQHVNVMSMLALVFEGANPLGSTFADYNNAASSAASARASYCTYIDATAFYSASDLSLGNGGDGSIHPGNLGHSKAYTGFNAAL